MEINVKKYVIKKLIEAYAAKYPFLDENDYRSLAIENYTEHEIALDPKLKNRMLTLNQAILNYGANLGSKKFSPEQIAVRFFADPQNRELINANGGRNIWLLGKNKGLY